MKMKVMMTILLMVTLMTMLAMEEMAMTSVGLSKIYFRMSSVD